MTGQWRGNETNHVWRKVVWDSSKDKEGKNGVKNLGISNFNTSSAGIDGSMCIMSALSEFSCATINTLLPEPTAGRTVESQKVATRLGLGVRG